MFHLSEVLECAYCARLYTQRWPNQKWCSPYCRRQGSALEGRAARRSWADQGRPIQPEVMEAFEREHARAERIAVTGSIRRRHDNA
jgi:hypothetical protein